MESKKEAEKIEIFSHSRLWLYENCPEFYKLKYIDKALPEMPVHISLFLGKSVHDSLEWLYHQVKNREVRISELIEYFTDKWIENFSPDVRIEKGDEREHYNKGVRYLVDYYTNHKPFNENVIAIERRVLFPLDKQGNYRIQGYIDRLDYNKGVYEVHDYKTNRYIKSQEEYDKDRQLALYHIGLKETFGEDIKVKLIWHFLAYNKKIKSERTEEQLDKLKNETIELIKKIKNTREWQACGKKFCDWCEFKKKKGVSYESLVNA